MPMQTGNDSVHMFTNREILEIILRTNVYDKTYPLTMTGVLLTCGAIDTFGSWTEIIPNTVFNEPIIISGVVAHDFSKIDELYKLELSCDGGTTVCHEIFIHGSTIQKSQLDKIPPLIVEKNTQVMARVKSADASLTVKIHLTYMNV
jgi:hypothetical protein